MLEENEIFPLKTSVNGVRYKRVCTGEVVEHPLAGRGWCSPGLLHELAGTKERRAFRLAGAAGGGDLRPRAHDGEWFP